MRIQKPNPPQAQPLSGYDQDLLAEMYQRMALIRDFELT